MINYVISYHFGSLLTHHKWDGKNRLIKITWT